MWKFPKLARLRADAAHRAVRGMPTVSAAYLAGAAVLLFPAVLKGIKAVQVSYQGLDLGDLAIVLAPDVAFGCATTAVSLVFARWCARRRGGAWWYWLPCMPTLLVVLGLTAIEHQAWVRSSSLLDWDILWYTIQHLADLGVVIAAETTVGGVVLLVGAGLLVLLPLGADLVAARVLRRDVTAGRLAPAIWLAAAVPFAALSLRTPATAELQPIAQSAAVGLLAGALQTKQAVRAQTGAFVPADADRARAHIAKVLAASDLTLTAKPERPRNVLLVVLESTRFDATDPYVPRIGTTPRLAALAAHGVRAERMYVDMPHTSKALVSILCGYSPRVSVEVTETEPGGLPSPCLPHVLGHFGYRSAFFQSAIGSYEGRHQFALNAGYDDIYTRESFDQTGFEETNYLSVEDKVIEKPLLRWVDSHRDKPFLITILTAISHHNYGLPSTFDVRSYPRRPARMGGRMPQPWADYNRYLNTLRYADGFLGDILDGLDKRKLLDDTLVVVVGDHGQGFYEHGQKAHNTVIWDEGVRVPLVFHHRGLFPEPRVIEGVRRQVDIVPTMLSGLGISHPPSLFDGYDMLTAPEHTYAYSSCWYDRRCAAETGGTIRVIDHFGNQPVEVYDLAADPFERNNLLRARDADVREKWQRYASAAQARIAANREKLEARYARTDERDERPWILDAPPTPGHPVPARLEEYLELIGYDAPTQEVTPGGFWDAVVYFKCLKPSERGWRLFGDLESVDARSEQVDHHPGGGRLYLHDCKAGTIVADRVRVWIPSDFPPGRADYWWGSVFLQDLGHVRRDNRRVARRHVVPLERGLVIRDQAILLAHLDVKPAYRPELDNLLKRSVADHAPSVAHPLEVRFGDDLVLVDARLEPAQVRRNASIRVTTTWRVEGHVSGPWQLYNQLVSRDENYSTSLNHSPLDGLHPIASWKPGTWVTDSYALPVNPGLPTGEAKVWIGLRYERKRMTISDAGNAVAERKRALIGSVTILP